jgi:uncharacterized protein (TIGR02996 family)
VIGHEAFIAAVEARPADDTPRLVYADWLDEHTDPRGEYLRAELRLSALSAGDPAAADLRRRLRALRTRIDPDWLALFDQPRVLRANPTPFPAAWWGVDLPGIRETDRTYGRYRYDTLPPISQSRVTGDFTWLPDKLRSIPPDDPSDPDELRRIAAHAERLARYVSERGLLLPPGFARWLTEPALHTRMPSCTDCWIEKPWGIVTAPVWEGGYFLPCHIDSQGCLEWYLYLTPDAQHAVVSSRSGLCPDWEIRTDTATPLECDIKERGYPMPQVWYVAPSFETFLYRWWVENAIWYKLVNSRSRFHDPTPFTPGEQAYIDFYRQHPATPAS